MKKENLKKSIIEEPAGSYIKTFSSQEEAERYNMIQNIERNDLDKFILFCNMLRLEKLYKSAKISDYKDSI